ncbi:EamA domain-containing membrane protein RarD [Pasteurella testudinis DSM 23072]|uniref:EamA domain-containing membrane protein RarD n=1 Tax=Pasteurella testudinis DSM 23072 TaxID=1122938 RepID=A0A1W1UBI9_9PAST|nr:DMT family transporter [Pasteurella testudinis]SMB78465.1 EamA domain-containing membrane protein RarD [Pasteurella testudinis DSM 23072]SUB52591.1 Predicted permease, DMT superfamily [Pasteurella testudinis]
MSQQTNTNYAAPLLIIGCVIFGLGSLIVKFVPVGAYAIAFWRLLVAALIFWGLMRMFKQKLPQSRKAIGMALLSGAFLGFDLALWHESIYAVGPGISTLLNSLQIFFLSAIGFIWFAERLTKLQLFSLMLAIGGVALIASPEFGHNSNAGWGFVSGIVSGGMLALSMVFVRKTQQVEQTALFPLMLLISLGGMLALFLPSLLLNSHNLYPTTWRDVGLILLYGALMQCFAWGLIAYAIPLLSLSVTGLLLLSEPVAALLIDYFWLLKPINRLQWLGAGLTLLAIYLGSLRTKKRRKKIK